MYSTVRVQRGFFSQAHPFWRAARPVALVARAALSALASPPPQPARFRLGLGLGLGFGFEYGFGFGFGFGFGRGLGIGLGFGLGLGVRLGFGCAPPALAPRPSLAPSAVPRLAPSRAHAPGKG